jgi:hypothetical protein
MSDDALRRRIGEEGRRTYERCFRPAVVVPKILDELQASLPQPARAG